jgi:two-component system sensor histidine kinase DesK
MRAMDRTADPVSGRRPDPAGGWQRGIVYAALVALIGPARDVLAGRTRSTWLAAAALAAFAGCFALIVELGRLPGAPGPRLPVSLARARLIGPLLASLVALAIAAALGFGRDWLVLFAFVAPTAAFAVPVRWAPAAIAAAAAAAVATLLAVDGRAASASGTVAWALAISMTGLVALLVRRRAPLIHELHGAQSEVAQLAAAEAVFEERLRFARDLHDLLGHSLSVIALKAELARELLDDHDAERAQTEVAELEHVARRALDEVREAVSGYRARTLDGELDRAQGALEAAGIDVRTSVVVAGLPPAIDELLARVVREAVTHVVRHSQAQRAEISLTAAGGVVHLEVSNDGAAAAAVDPAPDGEPDGGLPGMRERVAAAGGRLSMVMHDGGVFRVTAVVPLAASAAPAPRRARDAAR